MSTPDHADTPTHDSLCDVSSCDQPAVALVANLAGLSSPEYVERWVCRWHLRNAFGEATA